MTDEIEMPVEAIPVPAPPPDPDKEAAMRAAMFYERAKTERDGMLNLLEQAKIAVQVKDNQIGDLQVALATLTNRFDSLQNSYNEKVQDCADYEAILANHQIDLENMAGKLGKFEFSRVKRKRNGGAKRSESLPERPAGEVEMGGESPPVLAYSKPVLG